jgi:hypothetical protein
VLRSPDGARRFEGRFTATRMATDYIRAYCQLLKMRTISSEEYTSRRPAIDGGEPTGATFESWMRSKQKPL